MGFMSEIGNLLQQYKGATAEAPPPNVEQDFQNVAPQASQSAISSGLNAAFRSDSTPSFGNMVSQMFGQSNGEQRSGILNQLIAAAGPAVLSGGLASVLQGGSTVTPQQAQQVSPEQVQQIAEHAQRQDPSIVDKASDFYAQHPKLVQGLGAGALALVMSRMSQHNS